MTAYGVFASILATIPDCPAKTHKAVHALRHAGLLGIKYEVAVRSDLVAAEGGKEVLRGVVDAAVLG